MGGQGRGRRLVLVRGGAAPPPLAQCAGTARQAEAQAEEGPAAAAAAQDSQDEEGVHVGPIFLDPRGGPSDGPVQDGPGAVVRPRDCEGGQRRPEDGAGAAVGVPVAEGVVARVGEGEVRLPELRHIEGGLLRWRQVPHLNRERAVV